MKNFTLNVIMTLIMVMGVSLNVNAAPLYENLEDAQKALVNGLKEANEISSKPMDESVFERLKSAIEEATAVWDSNLFHDIDEIEKIMPVLKAAMEDAEKSVKEYEDYGSFFDAIKAYETNMLNVIADKSVELEGKYEEDDLMLDKVSETLDQYTTYLKDALGTLKSKVNEDMNEEAKNGTFDVELSLKKYCNIKLLSVDEVVRRVIEGNEDFDDVTGIAHVEVAPSVNEVSYGLNGNKVSKGYKGIVIKGGKKIMMK